jgi:Cu/Ag efflux protein CusF
MSITGGIAVGSALTVVIDPTATLSVFPTEAPQALSGSIVVAIDSDAPKVTLSPDDYRHLNFTDMRTDHWRHKKGYDCKSLL